jgi:hypothetical protein
VTLASCVLRSAAPLAWTELLVLHGCADGLGAALASRLRFCGGQPSPEVIAAHLRRVTAAAQGGGTDGDDNPDSHTDHSSNGDDGRASVFTAPSIDLSQPQNVWRCRAVIQQCSLALAKACKKGSRMTTAGLTSILGEAVRREEKGALLRRLSFSFCDTIAYRL